MDFDKFSRQINEAEARVHKLQEQIDASSPDLLLDQAFEELLNFTAELNASHDELLMTRELADKQRQRYQGLFDLAPDGYIVTDVFGKIEEANPAAYSLFNTSRSLIGKLLILFIFNEDRYAFRHQLNQLVFRGKTSETLELRLKPCGYTIPIYASLKVGIIYNKLGQVSGLHWLLRDVTEQKRMENDLRAERAQLKRLSARLVEVQEAERRAIASELHDELGQSLTGLNYMLAEIRSHANGATERVEAASTLVTELIEKVRNLSLALRPAMLDDLGLLPTLIWHFDRYTEQTRIKVHFSHQGISKRFAPSLETAVYRIVQEALTNVARHACVLDVFVNLRSDEKLLYLSVNDHGRGFNTDRVNNGASNGLAGIWERVLLFGGHLELYSMVGMGTSIQIDLPTQITNGSPV